MPTRASSTRAVLPLVGLLVVAACSSGLTTASRRSGVIGVVATTDVWGSILAQLGGVRVQSTAIITNPNTDPHDYEPTPADARAMASASVIVENGIGYDAWADRLIAANPVAGRTVINVGEVVGVPAGGNPHRWYSPSDVDAVARAMTNALESADPADEAYFAQEARRFASRLGDYHALIARIKASYAGVPVGASESIAAPLTEALGLDLVTPATFLKAMSEGVDPSASDKAVIDDQIRRRAIKVYIVNSQNRTPDVTAQLAAVQAAGIPVTSITETLVPATASFEQWQVAQLRSLQAALHEATGR